MPLINCPVCGRPVSDRAPQCPHCGHPIATPESKKSSILPWLLVGAAAVAACVAAYFIFSRPDTSESTVGEETDNIETVSDDIFVDSIANEPTEQEAVSQKSPREVAMEAYRALLSNNASSRAHYFLHDLTDDGVPELFVEIPGDYGTLYVYTSDGEGGIEQLTYQNDYIALPYYLGNSFALGYEGDDCIEYAYRNGRIVEVGQADYSRGWKEPHWTPASDLSKLQ